MKKLKFQIGAWVHINAVLSFGYDNQQQRTVTPRFFEEPAIGQVTGAAFIPMGVRSLSYGFDSPTTFTPKSTVFVYLVRTGTTNAEKRVHEEDLETCAPLPGGLPLRFTASPPWGEMARNEARNEAQAMERDKRGRFKST